MKQEKQPEALHLADCLDCGAQWPSFVPQEAANELRRQHFALNEWFEKTEWVQKTVKPRELGMHRADIMRTRIESLQAELVAEAARTAKEKLRADQMTDQHRMQCNMRAELERRVHQAEHVAHALAVDKIAFEAQLSAIGEGGVESLRKREQAEPVTWTPGPNEFKDWCSQWFGPDSDDSYLAKAVFNIPPMAQKFDRAALQAAPPAPSTLPEGWTACRIEYETGYPEDVAFGPQIMMDRLKKWLDRHFATLAAATAKAHKDEQA